jgi:hypothetical protein
LRRKGLERRGVAAAAAADRSMSLQIAVA